MQNNLVYQSNDLITAAYMMTIREKELLLACISQIDSRPDAPSISEQTKFIVTADQMKALFYHDGNVQNIYRDIEQATNRLYDREVVIALEDNKTLKTRFVSGVIYDPKKHQVQLSFAEYILPYLTQLRANFTKYKLIEVSQLSSIHAIRLYELIVCWVGQYQYSKSFELDDFKYVMGVAGKYKQFGQLKTFVIDKAMEEINESTNYKVTAEYEKKSKGKGFRAVNFKFHRKVLSKLEDKDGGLSQDKIKSIVNNIQFMNDYNDHPGLSYQGKMNTDVFKSEMMLLIQKDPESFNKKNKQLESYLPAIK